ncbi:MAG TPA: hypothetical protein VJ777_11220 [Mycobacterium sp.]|nr:hypothetical protein [Mycobacterium sp.]
MALTRDPNGTVWTVSRRWWPFPGDALDLTFGWFELILGALFAVLWPFWLLAKFCGARWVITVERDGHQVGRELVRGWGESQRRINELALEVSSGGRSGHFAI